MPVSPLSPRVSIHAPVSSKTGSNSAASKVITPSSQETKAITPSTTEDSNKSSSAAKVKRSKKGLIWASVTGLGLLGTAFGFYIKKGQPKPGLAGIKALFTKHIPVPVYIHPPASNSGFWNFLFGGISGGIGGGCIGYLIHNAGEEERLLKASMEGLEEGFLIGRDQGRMVGLFEGGAAMAGLASDEIQNLRNQAAQHQRTARNAFSNGVKYGREEATRAIFRFFES